MPPPAPPKIAHCLWFLPTAGPGPALRRRAASDRAHRDRHAVCRRGTVLCRPVAASVGQLRCHSAARHRANWQLQWVEQSGSPAREPPRRCLEVTDQGRSHKPQSAVAAAWGLVMISGARADPKCVQHRRAAAARGRVPGGPGAHDGWHQLRLPARQHARRRDRRRAHVHAVRGRHRLHRRGRLV